jgi:magnesium transporter
MGSSDKHENNGRNTPEHEPRGPRTRLSRFRLPGLRRKNSRRIRPAPGTKPGIDAFSGTDTPPSPGEVTIQCVDYGPARLAIREVEDLGAFLKQARPGGAVVRWIDVNGLHPFTVKLVQEAFDLHTLAAEDILNVPQRPTVDFYEKDLFIITRMLTREDDHLIARQISMAFLGDTLITFRERGGDFWAPIRERLKIEGARIRTSDASYLLYALLDAVVDCNFPMLEAYGEELEAMEASVCERPGPPVLRKIHSLKRELTTLRKVIWPMREVIDALHRDERQRLSPTTRVFLRDVYAHITQVLDIIETYRDESNGLADLYMSSVSNRMNDVMKVLTLMASFFIPITFLAGVYGMNFQYIPELKAHYGYPVFWGACAAISLGMWLYFRRKGWIGRP